MLPSLCRRVAVAGVRRQHFLSSTSCFAHDLSNGRRSLASHVEGTEDVYASPGHDHSKLRDANNMTRRAFTYMMLGTAGFAAAAAARPTVNSLLDTMNPSADVLALANVEVDLESIPEGQSVTIKWRGKPLFVRHRTDQEIAAAIQDDAESLRDPEKDSDRVKDAKWLILLGVCTHLGCVPLNYSGDWNGYFCPCHGSHYDTSGRIRKGPAPLNLEVPPYAFTDDGKVVVGTNKL